MSATVAGDQVVLSASAQRDRLWAEIEATRYGALPGYSLLQLSLSVIAFARPRVTLDRASDVLPRGRPKVFHPRGSVGLVRFVPAGSSPFTGLYRGAIGLARFSLAADPRLPTLGFMPGVAFKFFVDGRPSVNFVTLPSFEPQPSCAFFAPAQRTSLPPPRNPLLRTLFAGLGALARAEPYAVGVSEMAAVDASGALVDAPLAPPNRPGLELRPASAAAAQTAPAGGDFREDLARLRPGTLLYSIHAGDGPRIGDLFLESEVIASRFGDQRLFFRHQGLPPSSAARPVG